MELEMTADTPNYNDCADRCAFAKLMTKLTEEVKHCIKYPLFTWIVGGISATFMGLLIVVFSVMISYGGDISGKIDQLNTNVTNLRVEVTEKTTRIETIQDQYNIKLDNHINQR